MDEMDQYGEWDLTPLSIPPRSALYATSPIGMGTPLVESLTGYITRLAEAHSVFSGPLLYKLIVPLVPGYTPSAKQHALFRESGDRSTLLNGTGRPAQYAVSALEKLTLRTDLSFLTLLPLEAILPARAKGLIRLTKAWCPLCYEQWRLSGQPVYDPLLGFLQEVTHCCSHQLPLSTRCPYQDCKQALPSSLSATAEQLPLPDASFDLVTVALAFHWFDRPRFLAEAWRVLRPSGWLVIYANGFSGTMAENPAFERWNWDSYVARYPTPPRNNQPLTDDDARQHGFRFSRRETYTNDVLFSPEELANYLLTQSNVLAVIEQGSQRPEDVYAWVVASVTPLFTGPAATFRFGETGDTFLLVN